ncbi:MAG: hypothetical protein NT062_19200 [Proteobacteria bacterium]|nr:hypothetical protein [Pseudomonadota bacterium]
MRIPLVAALFVSLVGCVGVVDAGGTPGDDVPPAGTPDAPDAPTPRLAATIDKATVTTELGTTHQFKIALTASGDFAGAVTITPSIVDAALIPVAGWDLQLDSTSVTLATNGTGLVTGTLTIPTNAVALAGTVKFDVTSSLGAVNLASTVAVTKQVTLVITQDAGNGQCIYPPNPTTNLRTGTKLRFLNMGDGTQVPTTIIIHGENGNGIPHEGNAGIATNQAYEVTLNQAVTGAGWYCHSPGNNPGNLVVNVAN